MQAVRQWIARKLGSVCHESGSLDNVERAQALLAAIDRGGVVADPQRVNAIARAFGLEVHGNAPVAQTIERIRAAVEREKNRGYE